MNTEEGNIIPWTGLDHRAGWKDEDFAFLACSAAAFPLTHARRLRSGANLRLR